VERIGGMGGGWGCLVGGVLGELVVGGGVVV